MKSLLPFIFRFSSSFFSILTNFIVARHLGLDTFGIYSSMLSLTFLINIITDWGFNAYGSQMLARIGEQSLKINFIRQALQIKLFLSGLFSLVYIIIVAIFYKNSFYYYLGTPIILFSFLNPEWVARGLLLPEIASYRQLFFSLSCLGVFAILYFSGANKYFIFFSYSTINIISFSAIFYFINRKLNFSISDVLVKIKIDLSFIRETRTYFYGYLFNNAIYVCGVLFLSIVSAPIVAGEYASYYNLFSTLVAPVVITYGLFAPKYHLINSKFFYKSYYEVLMCILVCGVIFYSNGAFFYKSFYPSSKGFSFNSGINTLACIVFCLYCFENMFVVKFILENNPKKYLFSNLLAFILGIICYIILFFLNKINVLSCFGVLIVMQVSTLLNSILTDISSLSHLKNWNIFIFISLAFCIILLQYLTNSFIWNLVLSAIVLLYCAFYAWKILKKLY